MTTPAIWPASVTILQGMALGNLATAAGIAKSAGFAVLAAATAVANKDGMRDSSTQWTQLANEVSLIQRELGNAIVACRSDWIAEDRDAFVRVMDRLITELEDMKLYFLDASASMDTVYDIYKALWIGIAAVAAIALVALLALLLLFAVPYVGPAARAMAEIVGSIAVHSVSAMVKAAGVALQAIGAIVGASAAAGFASFGVPRPTGGPTGREDLQLITIDWQPPVDYIAPKRELPQPAGS